MSNLSPASVLYDENGNAVAIVQDGSLYRIQTSAKLRNPGDTADMGDAANPVRIDPTGGTTQPISAATLPLPAGAATETTLATRATEATLATRATEATLESINGTDGIKKITDELPAGTQEIGSVAQGAKGTGSNAWPSVLYDEAGNAVTVTEDVGVYRLEVTGKVSVIGALPPPSTNAFAVFADTPLTVGTHDTISVIPNGETLHIQGLAAGNEDPTKGAVVEVIFDDGTEHIVGRFYTNGQTELYSFADITEARDGTLLLGDGSNTVIVRRAKFAGSNIAIDAELRGYTV